MGGLVSTLLEILALTVNVAAGRLLDFGGVSTLLEILDELLRTAIKQLEGFEFQPS